MYIRASVLLFPIFALASLAAAAPEGVKARGGGGSCTSGTGLCCAQTFNADATGVAAIKEILGVTVDPVIGPLLSIGCSAFIGSCISQTVCCESAQSNNLVYVGCNNVAL
ncbi:hypothetical protein EDC04DRAFT_2901809 [Pisolithus marmoratus]|nr:hypothetical protein EDC04DRAFT_2901809 [Pisolithus marmoratus]